MSMLSAVPEAEFATLREALDVSDSVLSKHLTALAAQKYVRTRKDVHIGRRTTWIGLTAKGRRAPTAHVAALREITAAVP